MLRDRLWTLAPPSQGRAPRGHNSRLLQKQCNSEHVYSTLKFWPSQDDPHYIWRDKLQEIWGYNIPGGYLCLWLHMGSIFPLSEVSFRIRQPVVCTPPRLNLHSRITLFRLMQKIPTNNESSCISDTCLYPYLFYPPWPHVSLKLGCLSLLAWSSPMIWTPWFTSQSHWQE